MLRAGATLRNKRYYDDWWWVAGAKQMQGWRRVTASALGRMIARGRQPRGSCPHGSEYLAECKPCVAAKSKRYRDRKRNEKQGLHS